MQPQQRALRRDRRDALTATEEGRGHGGSEEPTRVGGCAARQCVPVVTMSSGWCETRVMPSPPVRVDLAHAASALRSRRAPRRQAPECGSREDTGRLERGTRCTRSSRPRARVAALGRRPTRPGGSGNSLQEGDPIPTARARAYVAPNTVRVKTRSEEESC